MNRAAAARRLEQVQQPVIPVMGELIRQTPGTLSLGQGMVSWGPPAQVHQAVAAALQQGDPGLDRYGPVAGSEALRDALELWLQREQGLDLSESCLLYTSPSPRDRTRSRMPSSA